VIDPKQLKTPFDESTIALLHAGNMVLITGVLYGARDAAHARLAESISRDDPLPFPLEGQVIYYVGPAPAKAGSVIGPAGPTTSGRMDPYTIPLLEKGVKGFVGKGYRSSEVRSALIRHHAVYLATFGGAAALLSKHIRSSRIVAYGDLGAEAIYELVVEDFPAIIVNDIYGRDAYLDGRKIYLEEKYDHGS
jgi:fumarate hydratase subunit beta